MDPSSHECEFGSENEDDNVSLSAQNRDLLKAVWQGDVNTVRRLLEEGADIRARDLDKGTALHIAVRNGYESIVQLLLEKGVDIEAEDVNGEKPLFLVAKSGNLSLARLLLCFDAEIESFNENLDCTAFYHAVINGHLPLARLFLALGADIDRPVRGQPSPLFDSVVRNDLVAVEFLLQNGANKKIQDDDGQTIEGYAKAGTTLMKLLRSDRLLQGPSILTERLFPEPQTKIPRLRSDEHDKRAACHGFEGTIVDFFVGDTEQRIEKTASVYEILYGKGPDAIMNSANRTQIKTPKCEFRWYHLPANNMEWVHALVNRHFASRRFAVGMLDEEFKAQLALSNSTLRQYRVSTKYSSFMRPQCRVVKKRRESIILCCLYVNGPELIGQQRLTYLHMPFLHFETSNAYEEMAQFLSDQKRPKSQHPPVNQRQQRPSTYRRPRRQSPTTRNEKPVTSRHPARTPIATRSMVRSRARSIDTLSLDSSSDTSSEEMTSIPGKFSRAKNRLFNTVGFKLPKTKRKRLSIVNQDDLEKGARSSKGEPASANVDPSTRDVPQSGVLQHDKLPVKIEPPELVLEKQETVEPPKPTDQQGTQSSIRANVAPTTDQEPIYAHEPKAAGNQESGPHTQNSRPEGNVSIPPGSELGAGNRGRGSDAGQGLDNPDGGSDAWSTKPEGNVPMPQGATRASSQEPKHARQVRMEALGDLDRHLVKGYYLPDNPGEAPLQLRRTLDQYFYTHLAHMSSRNTGGQVLQRYTTKNSPESKMWMVDQLWLWILNDGTCCPQRWNIWPTEGISAPFFQPSADPSDHEEVRPPSVYNVSDKYLPPPAPTNRIKRKDKGKPELSSFFKWTMKPNPKVSQKLSGGRLAKEPMRKKQDDLYSISNSSGIESLLSVSEDKRELRAFLRKDPLNVHQIILKHLQRQAREPITSVGGLATLITDTCIGLFDQHQAPDEFQFFDFFERSVGDVVDQEAQCFQKFAQNPTKPHPGRRETESSLSIAKDSQLLVEIKDIIDELGILKMVLFDQQTPRDTLNRILTQHATKDVDTKDSTKTFSGSWNTVLDSHRYRIERMENLANKSYQSLYNLLDLKQKQANVLEALSARNQAEGTFRQAAATNELIKQNVALAEAAKIQSEEAARQGRTVMLFTLPLSFTAAFFAINIDIFPWTNSGRIPVGFVLKYMFSISGAVSIPFILVAFNQDRVAQWFKYAEKLRIALSGLAIASLAAILAVIWTSSLASGIKAATSVALVFIAIIAVGSFWVWSGRMGVKLGNLTLSSSSSSSSYF
ncbi:hypothetical protein FQN57_002857 [Myotisia sp. PD_48]|nr:hypothetical protein FQN57_002857 [Myotisia sp. PD_48]